MSLLLEALKKAERAKEEAQRRVREEGGETQAAPAAEKKPVLTRDKLPDISAPLDIGAEDLTPARKPSAPKPELTIEPLAPEPKPQAKPARPAASERVDEQAPARQRAKKVFEAKFREPNPRLPFYITLGILGTFAVGTAVYFWYQLRPPPSLVNLNPPRQAEQAAPPPSAEVRPAPAVPAAPSPGAIAGLPAAASAAPPPSPSPAPAAAAPKPVAEKAVETPRLQPRIPVAQPAPPTTFARSAPQVHPRVEAGYAAYLAGDLATARAEYQEALRAEPSSRDALLGMAALEVRAGRYESAENLYLRVLQADPRDAQAHAALFSLRAGRADPVVTESRVKTLLAAEPSAHALNFTLGNQLASQNRWAEAQQEYFKAYAAEPDNADFAFNLAVSLDHLRQNRQALEYYQRAITLADRRGASFDLNAARQRASELSR
ncbi:MAG TPA: tetratricopeptide repeat protein [Burkholderiales bacterium]|nr:tetratricopeptide repeat protein [Burkholderiales bacterium]